MWWGELGCGKTACAVRQVVRFHRLYPQLPIFSNIPLFGLPYFRVDSPDFFFEEHTACIMLLDEIWTLANSNKSASLLDDVIVMFLVRSRKKKWRVMMTEQHWRQAVLRLRFITDRWCEPVIRKGFILYEEVKLKTGLPVGVPQRSDVTELYPFYDHTADPFTLDLVGLRNRWIEYKRKHGIV